MFLQLLYILPTCACLMWPIVTSVEIQLIHTLPLSLHHHFALCLSFHFVHISRLLCVCFQCEYICSIIYMSLVLHHHMILRVLECTIWWNEQNILYLHAFHTTFTAALVPCISSASTSVESCIFITHDRNLDLFSLRQYAVRLHFHLLHFGVGWSDWRSSLQQAELSYLEW